MDKERLQEILQMAVGTRDDMAWRPESLEEWTDLFHYFSGQALLGVTFPVVERISHESVIPTVVYVSWEKAARTIQHLNREHKQAVRSVYRTFADNGYMCCILKGQVSASMYPQPDLRQTGDIDIWTDGSREKVLGYLRSHFKVYRTRYIHTEVKMLDNIRVEVHFTPSWMFSPLANLRLQRWFSSHAAQQFGNYDDTLGACIPEPCFNGVYMMLHIYRHLLEEGVGLRQLMDYYYLLLHLSEDDRKAVLEDLKYLGLGRFAGAIMYVLEGLFSLDVNRMLCPPSSRPGRFVLDEIMGAGNFGRTDLVFANDRSRTEGVVAHGWRKIKRNLRFLFLFPSEVLWMPFFNTWHYFWRRKNGYLYKGR